MSLPQSTVGKRVYNCIHFGDVMSHIVLQRINSLITTCMPFSGAVRETFMEFVVINSNTFGLYSKHERAGKQGSLPLSEDSKNCDG